MTAAATATTGRRFALLLALHDSEYAKKAYGGYYNVFVSAFGIPSDRWDGFHVVDGEFPAAEDLARYDGFVITGSPFDAYGDAPWIRRLCLLVQALHAMRKRVLGVCFGHQLLCRALGGRVAKSRTGWDVGVRKVTLLAQDALLHGFLEEDVCVAPHHRYLIEVHQDEVWEIPRGARVLAYSEKTRVEAFAVGEHAMGVQGHPEYTLDILNNLIDRLTNDGSISRSLGEGARRAAAETGGPDRAFWTALCKGFLRGGPGTGSSSRPAAAATATVAGAPEIISSNGSRATVAAGCFVGEAPVLHQMACSAGAAGIN
ncbi:hypothetical protein PR202_ga06651 [Eleusine coracana subsp. coracana]|uniref:Glutamine amidotransferase domain-containing protein n=1 Tax=Eleusine coracana subsp. coracana TaxID=191504 RepID=A0AAV5BXQ9_ELECO|nr:hypothetical protein QOZ80_2AG0103670 [Eleusine coracana subsp. coracana]GJM90378.1 hypothetical protein PR202_ga06651 [Eleusine coracana subsp. coracana]